MMRMKNFERILVATDLSEMAAPLYIVAERLARQSETTLVMAHIASREEYVELRREHHIGLDEYLERIRSTILYEFGHATGVRPAKIPVEVLLRERSVAQDLLEVAARHKVDLIVIGSHGRSGISRALVGSVAEEVLRHATCPVLIVPKQAVGVVIKVAEPVPATVSGGR